MGTSWSAQAGQLESASVLPLDCDVVEGADTLLHVVLSKYSTPDSAYTNKFYFTYAMALMS